MANVSIIKIENNDADIQFRQKCNQNFSQIARSVVNQPQKIQIIADEAVAAQIILATADKATRDELAAVEDALTDLIYSICPVPVNGIYFHDDITVTDPATLPGFAGTTWASVVQTAIPAQAWKRIT